MSILPMFYYAQDYMFLIVHERHIEEIVEDCIIEAVSIEKYEIQEESID